ncbi:hypothetical protein QWY85_15820 [Neolewinella lacunae]|uniref:Uncharacterized protein n=1 Tax=Neolewinella lacunae TaxID=1517758 RepID=A0A923PNJ2_9BACT|nr:hypothetical protein [Neolewinella lacunae]MBC6993772.1 hypothetical protein [Neolewinella lacunae]MDN3636136.1 hypothetical protein [Neolewinella lacunae]
MYTLAKLLGIGALLLIICANAAHTAFDSYYGFYYEDSNTAELLAANPASRLAAAVAQAKPVRMFCGYTGFGTGYGFFAPNVASDFITLYEVKDACGESLRQTNLPPFHHKESVIRYLSATGMFLDKITKDSVELGLQKDFLDVVQRQMADYVRRQDTHAASVTLDLYLYDYATLAAAPRAEQLENLFYVDSQTSTQP